MNEILILFPHQLHQNHEALSLSEEVVLIEEQLFFREFSFHKKKLAYHRASMKAYQAELEKLGKKVTYIEACTSLSDVRMLIPHLKESGIEQIHCIEPTDNWLEKRIVESVAHSNINLISYESALFLNSRSELLEGFFKPSKKKFFQTSFYKEQRKKRNILMDNHGEPIGGKWTYDVDNRKKYPKNRTPPSVQWPATDDYWREAMDYVDKYFADNPGKLTTQPYYPYHRKTSEEWLQRFFEYRFHAFGDYEDAIVSEEMVLHHSVLTPMLNVGLLSPQLIVNRALTFAKKNGVPINSLEGFVRQIIGWREFIRGMYEVKGSYSRTLNFWGFDRKIPCSFYDGTTGIVPIDRVIKKVLKTGYCHHIERLMVLGNFMLLCEFDPKEVYQWFMELFIDAYDWVMVPNVYGMSQFADGGTFATKPYISGSNYLMKMSDFPKGEWQQTWDGLFWRFMHLNRDFFLKNPRLSMLVRSFDKMSEEKRNAHLAAADHFLDSLDKTS